MSERVPLLVGTHGLAEGEVVALPPHGGLVIGRSRSCDISFQRFRRFLAMPAEEQRLRDSYNASVSRRHLRISMRGSVVVLENLSPSGSWCDEQRFDMVHEADLERRGVVVRLGQAPELFHLALVERVNADRLLVARSRHGSDPDLHAGTMPTGSSASPSLASASPGVASPRAVPPTESPSRVRLHTAADTATSSARPAVPGRVPGEDTSRSA